DQPGGDLYFIKKGKIRVFRKGPEKKDLELATMGPGRVFGEMTFFDRGDHTANIAALEDSVFGVLNIEEFEKMAQVHPSLAYVFTRELFLEFQKLLRRMNDRYMSMMKRMHFLGSD
ncbi:MAG TPA: cyclic nucleotide-binding domain-containing protein, partial [Nitrospiria bacterium]